MRRCSKEAMARCELRKYCEPGAEFADDCECAKFNDKIMEEYITADNATLAERLGLLGVDYSNGTDYAVEVTRYRDKDGALHVRAMITIPPEREATT